MLWSFEIHLTKIDSQFFMWHDVSMATSFCRHVFRNLYSSTFCEQFKYIIATFTFYAISTFLYCFWLSCGYLRFRRFRVSKMMDRTRLLWRTQWSNSHFTGCYHPISYLSSLQVPFVIVLMLLNLRGISNLCPSPLKNKEPKGTIILNMFTSKWIRSSRYFYQRLNN